MTNIVVTQKQHYEFWPDDPVQEWDPVTLTGKRIPRSDKFSINDRVWFTWRGFLKGYFTIKDIKVNSSRTKMKIYLIRWKTLSEEIPMSSVRGWCYLKNLTL